MRTRIGRLEAQLRAKQAEERQMDLLGGAAG